jgi:hypothetical protein
MSKRRLMAIAFSALLMFSVGSPKLLAEEPLEEPPPEADFLDSILDSLLVVPSEEVSEEFPYPQLGYLLEITIPSCEPCLLRLPHTLVGVVQLLVGLLDALEETPGWPGLLEEVIDRVLQRMIAEPSLLINIVELPFGGIIRWSLLNPLTWPEQDICQAVVMTLDPTDPLGSYQACLYQISSILSAVLLGLPISGLAGLVSALPLLSAMGIGA